MAYLDTEAKRKRIQAALNTVLGLNPPLVVDGVLGPVSADAIIKARSTFGLDHIGEPIVDTDLMRELGLLTIQDPAIVSAAKTRGIDLLTLIGLIGPISNLLKGKTMTADQITGILRAVLTALGGYLVGKGIVDQATATQVIGALVTLGGAVWSIYSNRPKTITPMGK